MKVLTLWPKLVSIREYAEHHMPYGYSSIMDARGGRKAALVKPAPCAMITSPYLPNILACNCEKADAAKKGTTG
jgi:hypothetical protein